MKTVKCSFCGAEHTQVKWAYAPYSCGKTECENELIEREREQEANTQEAAQADNYARYY
jgi:hypothetical protein